MVKGQLTPTQIRKLREAGRCNDGDGLFREMAGPDKGNRPHRATINGRRREIGLAAGKTGTSAGAGRRRDPSRGDDWQCF